MKLIFGHGYNDRTRPCEINKKHTKEYNIWFNMLIRCYSPKYHDKKKTYKTCEMSENFKSYSYFYDWCQNQVGFDFEDFHIDKDLIKKGNKIYSEDFCIFIPFDVNQFLPKHELSRGDYPIGVSFDKRYGKFKASINFDKRQIHLGNFNNPHSAFIRYKKEKEQYAKVLADRYKWVIDKRAYDSLINYTVDISD